MQATLITLAVALLVARHPSCAFADGGAVKFAQFELNVGLLCLVTAAFVVVAVAFHRAIDRLAPEG